MCIYIYTHTRVIKRNTPNNNHNNSHNNSNHHNNHTNKRDYAIWKAHAQRMTRTGNIHRNINNLNTDLLDKL